MGFQVEVGGESGGFRRLAGLRLDGRVDGAFGQQQCVKFVWTRAGQTLDDILEVGLPQTP